LPKTKWAGKPVLMIPLTSEQYLFARGVEDAGLGLLAPANDIDAIRRCLMRLLEDGSFRRNASEFKRRYAHQSSEAIAGVIAERVDELLNRH
jgi:UDP:flavonoid glycosyltransferase YjiC (YdhE family)